MGRTNRLKAVLTSILDAAGLSVYYLSAHENAVMPYAEFELREMTFDSNTTRYVLEANIYDNASNPDRADDYADTFEAALDRLCYTEAGFNVTAHRSGQRVDVREPDRRIIRKRVNFEVSMTGPVARATEGRRT